MGIYSEAIFGRKKLPSRALLCAGVYIPQRKDAVKRCFTDWERVKGNWIRYSYAKTHGKDCIVLFGIYGAAMTLEAIQLLRDGGTKSLFFVGSMYAKRMPVGSIVIPSEAQDLAGIMRLDAPNVLHATPDEKVLELTRAELARRNVPYTEGRISSVPAVLHGIRHISDSVRQDDKIIGHEMEVSTFLHFARKHAIAAGALLYVSDNEEHSIISTAKVAMTARRSALRTSSSVAAYILSTS